MPKCLRCGAGDEWIQGRVPLEPSELTATEKPACDGEESSMQRVVRELAKNFRAESERWWAAATKQPTGNPMFTKYIERAESWAMAAERVEAEIEKLPNAEVSDAGGRP